MRERVVVGTLRLPSGGTVLLDAKVSSRLWSSSISGARSAETWRSPLKGVFAASLALTSLLRGRLRKAVRRRAFIGIDFGTSGCRAACVDKSGRQIAEASVSYSDPADPAGWREALREVLASIPERGAAEAICLDGTSASVLLCDHTGAILEGPLMYNYSSAPAAVQRCKEIAPSKDHVAVASTSTLAKAFEWVLRGSVPQGTKCSLVHQADWLAGQLHGGAMVTDFHNALKLGYDTVTLQWPDWLLQDPEIGPILPGQVVSPGTDIGHVSAEAAAVFGLPQSCTVRAGTTDSIAAFLAAGTTEVGEAVTSLGSTLAIKMRSLQRVEDAACGIYSHRLGGEPVQWLVGGASNSGGAVLRQLFRDEELVHLSTKIDPETSSGLDYYPLPRQGERFPVNDAAMMPRMDPRPDDDALFLKGLFEGMGRIEARGYERLKELGAGAVVRVLTAGGGARNSVWGRIRGRLLGVPVEAAPQTQAAYGTALLALKGSALLG